MHFVVWDLSHLHEQDASLASWCVYPEATIRIRRYFNERLESSESGNHSQADHYHERFRYAIDRYVIDRLPKVRSA